MCFFFYLLLISWAKQRRKLASLSSEFHYLQIFLIQDNASLAGSWDSSIKNFPPFSHQWAFVTAAFSLGTWIAKKFRSLFSPFCVTVAGYPQILYHFQLSISPFPMKIRCFYFWFSVRSSSLCSCLPRPTTSISFLLKMDLSVGILTTAWQPNRKMSPTELWSCSIFSSIRKGLQHHAMLYKEGVV